ncbi:Lytic transglycosylase catalytic [Emticicia oligotrophica DSM 17448]|uniref:Lytic transglycosylase catalytic n=1 Tax=Emticicia oligotrophica (strain DSM 17448 / CIP 109782 / MTCC 6937 / GPTSA100-15) TaxID=929562 RepID=A0ABM5N5A8_EMTOG|nr:LysM peptidoglycan-binding domain-containing protein [Emticicia oligotrophica]AFK04657.1 Lytic transglycosylase catalytic [Emticicia oligotrophica DSM 17448]
MKKIIALVLLSISFTQTTLGQRVNVPDVPKKVEFAGITIKLDDDAQKLIQKEVNTLLTPENKYLIDKLERIQWYFPVIESILEEEEIPEDFKYVAVAESSLLPDAISSSNAVGFWQMKQATAQELGLRIDSEIDERKNIYASTKAAALYLKRNNLIYKNWVSTLYSYTLGVAGVSKLIPPHWANGNEINFDGQTDRYLLKTIAHRIAFEYRINRMKESRFSFVEYRNSKGKSLDDIATIFDVDAIELKKLNSWLIADNIPRDKDYSVAILVPIENLENIQSKLSKPVELTSSNAKFPILKRITPSSASPEEPVFYEINGKKGILAQAGDDIAALARNGKMKIPDFLRYNDMTAMDLAEEGRIYYLQKKNKKGPVPQHIVLQEQNLWQISQIYGIRLKNLLRLNRLRTVKPIQKGRVIYLQKKRPKNEPIDAINTKEIEESENVPLKEQYENTDEKAITKENTKNDRKKENKTPKNNSKNTNIPENTSVVETNKQNPRLREEDDIIVISDSDETEENTNRTPINQTPPATVKNTPVNPIQSPVKPNTGKNSTPITNNVQNSGTHKVEVGQTLYSIARQYNITIKELAEWNDFSTTERVKIGQVLIVTPPKTGNKVVSSETSKTTNNSSEKNSTSSKIHKVQRNETLYSISKQYGVTMKQIKEWNDMKSENVKIGQKIIIKK